MKNSRDIAPKHTLSASKSSKTDYERKKRKIINKRIAPENTHSFTKICYSSKSFVAKRLTWYLYWKYISYQSLNAYQMIVTGKSDDLVNIKKVLSKNFLEKLYQKQPIFY